MRQRTGIAVLVPQSHQGKPCAKLQQEMRHALDSIATPHIHQMLDHHRLVPGRRPQDCRGQPGRLRKCVQKVCNLDFSHLDIRHRLNAVIRDVQKNTAQTQEVAGDLEIHDLPLTILKKLVGTGPAGGEDISGLIRLPLMDKIPPGHEGAAALVQGRKHRQFRVRQGDECAELSDKRSVFDHLFPSSA